MMKRYLPFYPLFIFLFQSVRLGGISWRRIPFFLIYVLRFIVFEPFRLTELILFDFRIRKHVMREDPIFILGHWRSGTSHMQNILNEDPNFSTTNLYRMLFPDHYVLTESWMMPLLNRFAKIFRLKYAFQRSQLDLSLSGELDTALCSFGSTQAYTWAHLFPKRYQHLMQQRVFTSETELDLSDYDYLIRKLSWKSKNKRIIVKSPGDTGRIKALLKRYPNASFIYLSRGSYDVYHSSMYLWEAIQRENSLQQLNEEAISNLVKWTFPLLMKNYEEQKSIIPKKHLIELSFEDLHDHTESTIKKVYQELALGDFDAAHFATFLQKNQAHRKAAYPIDSHLLEQLKNDWDPFFLEG